MGTIKNKRQGKKSTSTKKTTKFEVKYIKKCVVFLLSLGCHYLKIILHKRIELS